MYKYLNDRTILKPQQMRGADKSIVNKVVDIENTIDRLKDTMVKRPLYRDSIRPELADELYDKIIEIIVVQKKYRDSNFTAKDLAKELKTNTRYLSAVINSRFGKNYSSLLNEYRVKDALHMLLDKRFVDKNIEEISAMVGFANRQSFYAAFMKHTGETPHSYRRRNLNAQ